MESVAASVYGARLRVHGWLPTWLLLPAVFLRNVALGLIGGGVDLVAPARVEVFRLTDQDVIGTIPAGSSYYEQQELLGRVQQDLSSRTWAGFLSAWNLVDVDDRV